jgi:hypothetical protein
MSTDKLTYLDFTPTPPRNPATSAALMFRRAFIAVVRLHWQVTEATRFQVQREIEIAAARLHDAVIAEFGSNGLPALIPFHWSPEKLVHYTRGKAHPVPSFIATIGTRVSAFHKRSTGDTGLQGVAA